MRIGFIGTGVIASAVVQGIADQGDQIIVSNRNADIAADLANRYGNVRIADNAGVLKDSDVIMVALMADRAAQILDGLPFATHHQVISLMAEISLNQLDQMIGPATAHALIVPFPAIATGGSPVLTYPGSDLIDKIFGAKNTVFALASDTEMAGYLAAQAVVSPALRLVSEAAIWLGDHADPQQGEAFLRHLVGGSIRAAPVQQTLKALDTPGGFNAQLRDHMDDRGLPDDLRAGLDALLQRQPIQS